MGASSSISCFRMLWLHNLGHSSEIRRTNVLIKVLMDPFDKFTLGFCWEQGSEVGGTSWASEPTFYPSKKGVSFRLPVAVQVSTLPCLWGLGHVALAIPCQLGLMVPSGSSSQNIVAAETSKNWNKQAQHLCCWWPTPACLCLQIFGLLLLEASLLHPSGDVSADKTAEHCQKKTMNELWEIIACLF